MSKPDKPGELRDVTVEAISLVSKAANREKFKIFKSAEKELEAPEVVKKDERGLFRILKDFFTGNGEEAVAKGEVADITNAQDKCVKLNTAIRALLKVLGFNEWGEMNDKSEVETDPAKIVAAIEDFHNVALEILIGKTDVTKSGRKISGDRLGKLKNIRAMLNEILNELDDNGDTPEEAEEVTKEEIQKTVEEAMKNALSPVMERIEKIENARGISNRVPEDSAVKKNENDFWGGIF